MPTMTLNDGTQWEPKPEQIEKWTEAYQAIDVPRELLAASAWLESNPKRRKTSRGIARFCNSWLARAQDKGGSGMTKPGVSRGISTRDMTTLDDLTHDFADSAAFRQTCLAKHGQYYKDGERFTQ